RCAPRSGRVRWAGCRWCPWGVSFDGVGPAAWSRRGRWAGQTRPSWWAANGQVMPLNSTMMYRLPSSPVTLLWTLPLRPTYMVAPTAWRLTRTLRPRVRRRSVAWAAAATLPSRIVTTPDFVHSLSWALLAAASDLWNLTAPLV